MGLEMFELSPIKPGARDGEISKIGMKEDKAEFLVDRGNAAMITRKVQCAWRAVSLKPKTLRHMGRRII